MKKSDLDKMTDDDLKVRLTENKEELASALMKFRMGQFKRTSEFPRLRKDIARINTLLSKRTAKAGA
jgi:ribosomal protein L29